MNEGEELIDALAGFLADEEPEGLAAAAARALVASALVAAREDGEEEGDASDTADDDEEQGLVDAAADLLAEADPEPLDDEGARSLAETALAESSRGGEVVPIHFRYAPLIAAAAVMLFVVTSVVMSSPGVAPPSVHRFESGHRIVVAAGSLLDWDDGPDGLDVRLRQGEAMFDIDPSAEQVVRVLSGGVTVRVTGTVFTVGRQNAVIRVAVFEGSVAVAGGGPLSLLTAGDRWEGQPGHGLPVLGAVFEPRLTEEATWAAERRLDRAAPVDDFVPTLPEVPDLAADGRLRGAGTVPTTPSAGGEEVPIAGTGTAPAVSVARGEEGEGPEPAAGREGWVPTVSVSSAGTGPGTGTPRMEDARGALTARRYAEARALADRALSEGATADWLLVRGDALRGEGRLDEAAAEYAHAAVVGDARDRAVAGLSAARVLGRDLGRTGPAREILLSSGALDPSSPVRVQAESLVEELGGALP